MIDPRTQDKIRKLLALAADPGAAPNEAETAARQAAKLMARYNLSLADLDAASREAEWDLTSESMIGAHPGERNPSAVPLWIGFLAFGVKLYTRTRCTENGPLVHFKGPRQDVELALWMLKALIDQAYTASKGTSDPHAYRMGYSTAIQSRLRCMTEQRQEVDLEEAGTALVPLNNALKEAMDREFGEEGSGVKRQVNMGDDGYAAGVSAKLPLDRPIAQRTQVTLPPTKT